MAFSGWNRLSYRRKELLSDNTTLRVEAASLLYPQSILHFIKKMESASVCRSVQNGRFSRAMSASAITTQKDPHVCDLCSKDEIDRTNGLFRLNPLLHTGKQLDRDMEAVEAASFLSLQCPVHYTKPPTFTFMYFGPKPSNINKCPLLCSTSKKGLSV